MAKTYEIAIRGVAAASAAPYWSLATTAAQRCRVREIGIFLSAATATAIGLGRPANDGLIVQVTTSLGQALDPGDVVAVTNVAATWTTAPTAPTAFLRRISLPATGGAGVIWTWSADAPLIVNTAKNLCLWNFGGSAGAAPDVYIKFEE